jgi:anti-sigma factor RsiW
MNCDEVRDLVDAFVDNELPEREKDLVERHAEACTTCRARIDDAHDVRKQIQSLPRFIPTKELSERIAQGLQAIDPASHPATDRGLAWRVATYSSTLAAGILMTLVTMQFLAGQGWLADELLSAHLRYTWSEQFGTVASSDRHTVAPWFTGKLDYAPPVRDLSGKGFALRGGRVDYVDGRATATLIYARRKHSISLFVLPRESMSPAPPAASSTRGFSIVSWQSGQFRYFAVSDVSAQDLSEFARLMQASLGQE